MDGVTGAVPEPLPDWLTAARRITVLTGAGISTDSGIPDYRGPAGRVDAGPGRREARDALVLPGRPGDPAAVLAAAPGDAGRRPAAQRRAPGAGRPRAAGAAAGAGHPEHRRAAPGGGLERRSGARDPRHRAEVVCTDCGDRMPIRAALDRVAGGEADPACRLCGGILKTATVYFGELLDERVVEACTAAAADCDVLLAVGHVAAGLARRRPGRRRGALGRPAGRRQRPGDAVRRRRGPRRPGADRHLAAAPARP